MTEGVPLPHPTVPSSTPFETDSSTLTSFLGLWVMKLEGWEIHMDAEPQPGKRWERESPRSRVPSPSVSRFSTEVIRRVRSTMTEKHSSSQVIASYSELRSHPRLQSCCEGTFQVRAQRASGQIPEEREDGVPFGILSMPFPCDSTLRVSLRRPFST